ncbi:hypothetical protein LTR09_012416 [Extremus antarcticus]|uniref:Uncharacterized protein n=1 Tax=Extremus antarcticus TaxID=702011 RepID=A0AAJ0D9Z5_9PEZI|nr:hypothetical protein LTR09_012416 [Extremus antarcticus]
MAALEDLATYIDLLSLRAGSPFDNTCPEAIDLVEEDEPSDLEACANTARQDDLSESRGNLRERFLNRLSELFAAERNGRSVTAAVLREVERDNHVEIWLARNDGFGKSTAHKTLDGLGGEEMVKEVERALNQLATKDECQGNIQAFGLWLQTGHVSEGDGRDLWTSILRHSSPRLQFYRQELVRALTPYRASLQSMLQEGASAPETDVIRVWNDIHCHVFDLSSPTPELQVLQDLVRIGVAVRRATRTSSDLVSPFGSPPWARRVMAILCLVGKISSAYDTLLTATSTIWQGYTFTLIPLLQATVPTLLPRRSFHVASAFERLGVAITIPAIKAYTSKLRAEDKFAAVQKERKYVHAEVQLLFHLAGSGITGVYPYIGTSKLPCVLCAELLKAEGTLKCRQSHEHLYTKWMVPEIKTLPREAEQRMWVAIDKMKEAFRLHLLSPPQKGSPFRPQSTVDITTESNSETEGSSTMISPALTLALEQRREKAEQDSLSHHFFQARSSSFENEVEVVMNDSPAVSQHLETEDDDDAADYLYSDLAMDEMPVDPDVLEDYGFKQLTAMPERSKLLGLYQGLLYLEVTAEELHDWRLTGVLVDRIIDTYARLPYEEGGYFPWFMQKRHNIFPSTLPVITGVETVKQACELAKWFLRPTDQLRPVHELRPDSKRAAFVFAAMLMQMTYPPPGFTGPYLDFGFCACTDETEEQALVHLYQYLLLGHEGILRQPCWEDVQGPSESVARFSHFWQAFETGTLVQLMDRNSLKSGRLKLRHLEQYLNSSQSTRELSVWKLLTFMKTTDEEAPPRDVFIDFKFIQCINPLETARLKRLYAVLLARTDVIALQEAQAAGELLPFIQQHVEVDQEMVEVLERTPVER